MSWLDVVVMTLAVSVVLLTYKLFRYRAAIIQLQADMTLVLNELTKPIPHKLRKVQ